MSKLLFSKFKLTVIILLVGVSLSFGQTMFAPYWMYDNHYLTDKYLLNPAFAGYQYYPKIFVSSQQIEMSHSIDPAPSINIFGAHGRLGIKHNYFSKYLSNDRSRRNSVGFLVFADKNGPFRTTGIKLDYVYSVPLNYNYTSSLSFGLGGILVGKTIKFDSNIGIDDPFVLENTGKRNISPDFNAGALLVLNNLYVSFSVSQLMENSFNTSKTNFTQAQAYRNYYLMAGYCLNSSGRLKIEPSIAIGHNFSPNNYSNLGNFLDVNLEMFLKPVVFTQSYRINGYYTFLLMYRLDRLEMGVRAEWFPPNNSYAQFPRIALMVSYTFVPVKFRKQQDDD